jgi:Pyruvate/2-oxoacid:ferredoxin oxidoreductase gamma subunit
VAGIYLLGYAIYNKFLPLKSESVISAIEKVIPEQFLELNLKAFNLAKNI